MPPRPADSPPEPDYSQLGVLEDLATRAGLTPESVFDATWAYEYADKDAIAEGLAKHRTPDGSYRLHNEFHYLIARA